MFTYLRRLAATIPWLRAAAESARGPVLALAASCLLLLGVFVAPAAAAGYGQVESWGSYGFAAGQFANPVMLGANSSDGTVFAGDFTKIAAGSGDSEFLRIQKLSPSGSVLGNAELRRFADPGTDKKPIAYFGIAVDPSLGRFYVLEARKFNAEENGELMARQILVFSTTPKEGKLVAPEGGPSTLPVPAEAIFKPRQIGVDPSNHDLILMGENRTTPKRTRLQRISSSGVAGALFIDSGNVLRPNFESPALSFATAPTGVTYAVVGLPTSPGKGHTRAFELNPAFTTIQAVPGFAEAIDGEEPGFGFEENTPTQLGGGPQMAISSDGDTLYWKERAGAAASDLTTPTNILVRGFSLSEKATTVVYGGGEATKCRIETSGAGLAVSSGGKLVVFDYGPIEEEKDVAAAYADKVYTFGPGGSNCTAPTAKFKANGSEGAVKVKQGETVSFDASGSELASGPGKATAGFRRELIWDFGDGVKEVVKGEGGGEAAPTTTHKYTSAGNFTAKLTIRLENPTYGNPARVEHGVEVEVGGSEFQLKVTRVGSGTVTSSPLGISCGVSCQANFSGGTVVTLSGTPEPGFQAPSWSGCDAIVGLGECRVTMSAAKDVTATFEATPSFTLKVKKQGTGSGTVTSNPAGINCGSGAGCEASFLEGTVVTLSGSPAAGSKAVAWTTCPGTVNGSNQCVVTMSAAKEAVATFTLETHLLKVTKAGSGSGTVTSSPAGINCGSGAGCEALYDHGTVVKLSGSAGAGSQPVVWTGCDAVVGANECEVTVSAAKNVTATFSPTAVRALIVTRSGSGSGTVSSSPAGIDCGGECSHEYAEGTHVTLSGAAGANTKAVAWSGCDAVLGANECEVTMSAAKNVTATFDLERHLLKVTKAGSGSGTVTSSPAGINCGSGAGCEALYDHGTVVKLSGSPAAGSKAVAWTACPGTVNGADECEVTMSAAKEAVASFDVQPPNERLLKVAKVGTGSGTVTSSPAGINCGSGAGCEASFLEGTVVTLSGSPAAGSKPVAWTTCPGTVNGSNQCVVTMSAAKEAVASFDLAAGGSLTVTRAGAGSGTVSSADGGIECGSDCSQDYLEGTVVTLTAALTPGTHTAAVQWSGCGTVTVTGACEVTVAGAEAVTATFQLEKRRLTVTKAGAGSGWVASAPAGVGCGGTCLADFEFGKVVLLTGTAGEGSAEVAWSGCDAIVGANRCEVRLEADRGVTATFASTATPPPAEEEPPAEEVPPPKKKRTAKQKALAKCKKLKGRARARCIKKAKAKGKRGRDR
jgi:hypothetical protein